MSRDLTDMRVEYVWEGLREEDARADPLQQFDDWFRTAEREGLELPNAMLVATCGADGQPSARYVLLKEVDDGGFVFYSHSNSPKGRQLGQNPRVALVFYWHPMHRQVRIEGTVQQLEADRADAYFASRPRGAQLSAWAGRQSSVLESREDLHRRVAELEQRYAGQPVPRPPHWLGFRVVPERFEFWQGQADRLHDRLQYRLDNGHWVMERLIP